MSSTRAVLITAGALIDGTGGPAVRPGALLIEGDRVRSVGAHIDAPADVTRLDFPDATITPGLIDCHVHLSDAGLPDASIQDRDPSGLRVLRMAEHARRTLVAGFTTVRDVGGRDHLEFALRRAAREGLIRTPRLVLAGKIVSMTSAGASSWPGMYRQADGVREVVKAVREQVAAGADVIKIMATGAVLAPGHERPTSAQFSRDELKAAVDTAHEMGLRVAAHAHGIEGIARAVEVGVDTIEHGTHLHEDAGVAREMAARGVFLVPTLKALARIADPEGPGVPEDMRAKAHDRRSDRDRTFRLALELGVPIAMGTDAATPFNRHGENAQELELMVLLGMSSVTAIAAASGVAARAVGRDDIGLLAPGKLADVVVWDGMPDEDIRLLQRVPRAVFLGGDPVM
ncbi:MAG TPA: amidohydrolase family protein [Candidatus Limnocylindria bacterium]|nr:amidohydrolase family protein [Candidatus Limnocylindria bacterium]